MKRLEELINNEQPGIKLVYEWIKEGDNQVEILPPSDNAAAILHSFQITTRSPMGAIVFETGGILVDEGWLRIRGSGCEKLPRSLNVDDHNQYGYVIVADDAVGGFFALNGGGLGEDLGNIYYAAPDTTEWEPLELGYSAFLSWTFTNKLSQFYEGLRWENWKMDLKELQPNKCFGFYPFLRSKEGDVETAHREAVPVEETWNLRLKFMEL